MTGFEIIILIVAIVLIAVLVAGFVTKDHDSLKDMVEDAKDIEVKAKEVADELYNKDLRPIVAKKTTEKPVETTKSEFPIDKPKKKRKYYPKKKKTQE
jgi:FtsZ-interacting cell division protein ZipA